MLAASSFDDILAITLFSVFSSVAIDGVLASYPDPAKKINLQGAAEGRLLEGADDGTSVKKMIGMNVFYVVTGLFCAGVVGNIISSMFTCCEFDKKTEDDLEKMSEFMKGKEEAREEHHDSK